MHRFSASRWSHRLKFTGLLTTLSVIWLYVYLEPDISYPSPEGPNRPTTESTNDNIEYLSSKINLSPQFWFASRAIRTRSLDGERPDMTVINEPLFPERHILDKDNLSDVIITHLPPLTLLVPSSPKTDTSILSFGIATAVARLSFSLDQLEHWLSNSQAPLHVITPPVPEEFPLLFEVQHRAARLNIDLHVHPSNAIFPIAYFSLLKLLYETRTAHTKWLVLIDDDTFVPSLHLLVEHLNKNYDPEKEAVVAAKSENIFAIRDWGLIAYGGGGIFVSIPLAARLISPEIWDICVSGMGHFQGDQIFSHCLFDYTNVRPIFDPLLNQMDFQAKEEESLRCATADGFFESGRRALSVHHWRSWFQVDIPAGSLVSKACGDAGIWQRWMFPQQNLVLSNGFSIVEYPAGVDKINFDAVEMTWTGEPLQFEAAIGPLRPPLKEGEKQSYRLVVAEILEGVGVRQLYYREGGELEIGQKESDGVLELLWLF